MELPAWPHFRRRWRRLSVGGVGRTGFDPADPPSPRCVALVSTGGNDLSSVRDLVHDLPSQVAPRGRRWLARRQAPASTGLPSTDSRPSRWDSNRSDPAQRSHLALPLGAGRAGDPSRDLVLSRHRGPDRPGRGICPGVRLAIPLDRSLQCRARFAPPRAPCCRLGQPRPDRPPPPISGSRTPASSGRGWR